MRRFAEEDQQKANAKYLIGTGTITAALPTLAAVSPTARIEASLEVSEIVST